MSTRATYQFKSGRNTNVATFYIHHDGYPGGAVLYLLNGIQAPAPGGLAEGFFRANDRAEFTPGQEAHGDTDYRYTVESLTTGAITICCEKRRFRPDGLQNEWTLQFSGDLADFVNIFGREHEKQLRKWAAEEGQAWDDAADGIPRLHKVEAGHQGIAYGTLAMLQARDLAALEELQRYRSQWPEASDTLAYLESVYTRTHDAVLRAMGVEAADEYRAPPEIARPSRATTLPSESR